MFPFLQLLMVPLWLAQQVVGMVLHHKEMVSMVCNWYMYILGIDFVSCCMFLNEKVGVKYVH